MLKNQKEIKISSLQIIILSVISIIISVGGVIAFSYNENDTLISIFLNTFLVVLAVWNIIFVISTFFSLFREWIRLRKIAINIFRTKYDSKSYILQICMCSVIISIILLPLIIIVRLI